MESPREDAVTETFLDRLECSVYSKFERIIPNKINLEILRYLYQVQFRKD
jgi:hypothetical protein